MNTHVSIQIKIVIGIKMIIVKLLFGYVSCIREQVHVVKWLIIVFSLLCDEFL